MPTYLQRATQDLKRLNHKDLLARGGLSVVPKDIAGARFVSQGDARVLERVAA